MNRFIYFYGYLYLLFPLAIVSLTDNTLSQEETRLIRMLLNESTYLKNVRPAKEVVVDIRFIFNQIVSMVEKEQIIVTNCFVDQKWTGRKIYKKKSSIPLN